MQKCSNEVYAYLELKQDLFFHKIPADKIRYYVEESLKAGIEMAEKHHIEDIHEFCQTENITIEERQGDGDFYKVRFRAQFEYNEGIRSKIILYLKTLNELAQECELDLELVKKIHLFHEVFHYLEYKENSEVSDKLASVETMKVLGFKRQARIQRTSEIAAHYFAMVNLSLDFMGNALDYQYLYKTGKMKAEYLKEATVEYQKLP